LEQLKGKITPGFFHYSLSSDLYNENIKWGLGNTVFAIKIYATLGLLKSLSEEQKKTMASFIKSFQKKDGAICDPLIRRLAWKKNLLLTLKNKNLQNIFGKELMRAETRQAISSLKLLDPHTKNLDGEVPQNKVGNPDKGRKGIIKYLSKLNWQKPWHAGSHFSHLLFFLQNSDLTNKNELTNTAIKWINEQQNPQDGAWYQGHPSLQQKINGAMKIITGLKVAEKMNFKYPEKLIDLCLSANPVREPHSLAPLEVNRQRRLSHLWCGLLTGLKSVAFSNGAKNNKHACDNFNIIYVLHYANKVAGNSYRVNEIKVFAEDRLEIYKRYYFPAIGGFSFLPNKANIYYYGAKITRGLNEPDIHGTCVFLWGISIISQILGIDKELGFNEQTP